MTKENAKKIFDDWRKNYIEIGEKLNHLFPVVPKYFLPYPVEVLEEAFNIIAKDYFDGGDKETASYIQRLMVLHLGMYSMSDDEVLEIMRKHLELISENPDLKEIIFEKLKESQEGWIKFRNQNL